MMKHLAIAVFAALVSPAAAQMQSAPLLEPKPMFVPGLYETEEPQFCVPGPVGQEHDLYRLG